VGAAVLALLLSALAPPAPAATNFPMPPAIRPQVDFWIGVFATYSRHRDIIHDTEHLDRIYTVLDFRDLEAEGVSAGQIDALMRTREDEEKNRIRAMLFRLQEAPDPATLTAEELRLQGMFAHDPSPTKFMDAASPDRLRGQRGLRERFAQGIAIAHAYFPYMEIFRRNGVAVDHAAAARRVDVQPRPTRRSGAAGIWQFMPGTARNFMRVDDVVDDGSSAIATAAAATFMRQNYDKLGTWPLAIKAHNHGPAGMARAVRDTGTTDIAIIIQNYKGTAFKFASRNFYPEFLAAVHVGGTTGISATSSSTRRCARKR
jgi:membrane-bound lytic murein transglycosylase D